MRVTDKFVFYYTQKDFPSHHHLSGFMYKNVRFNTVEHFMMFQKAVLFMYPDKTAEEIHQLTYKGKTPTILTEIVTARHPQHAKRLGRRVANFDEKVWREMSERVLIVGNWLKFRCHDNLREKLLGYGDRQFVEASLNDREYGVGLSEDDDAILNPDNWRGDNRAGKIITKVRDMIVEAVSVQHQN